MSGLHLDRPWLRMDLGGPHRVLSWAINRPGFVTARDIVWREVRNADLPPDLDVQTWFDQELIRRDAQDAVAFLTSRDIRAHYDVTCSTEGISARCVATVGLSNAERVGARVDRRGKDWGTINVAVQIGAGLTDAALIESLSIAAQARTLAVIEAGHQLPTGVATGTGTDCIAIAAPVGAAAYAGLHTPIGEAVGKAVYEAVRQGTQDWMRDVRRPGG
jgi:adenosylcobinamide amidohydrolase